MVITYQRSRDQRSWLDERKFPTLRNIAVFQVKNENYVCRLGVGELNLSMRLFVFHNGFLIPCIYNYTCMYYMYIYVQCTMFSRKKNRIPKWRHCSMGNMSEEGARTVLEEKKSIVQINFSRFLYSSIQNL